MLQEASLCGCHMVIAGYKASSHRWGDIAGIWGDCRYVVWSESSPGTWAATPGTKNGHVTPPSCFVDKSEWLFTQNGIKSNLRQMKRRKHPLLRPTGERGKQPQTNFASSFKNAWEGHWDSACRFISTHGRGENRSDKLADAVLCACAAAHGSRKESLFHLFWNFAWDRLASQIYVATATPFLMKQSINRTTIHGYINRNNLNDQEYILIS